MTLENCNKTNKETHFSYRSVYFPNLPLDSQTVGELLHGMVLRHHHRLPRLPLQTPVCQHLPPSHHDVHFMIYYVLGFQRNFAIFQITFYPSILENFREISLSRSCNINISPAAGRGCPRAGWWPWPREPPPDSGSCPWLTTPGVTRDSRKYISQTKNI